ncbi:MAG: serine/threonine protein kinase [Myxococcales bacterium]|nr:serine/threonine protein kinase [Myxococcales bacterium]
MSERDPFGLVGKTIDGKYLTERVVGEGGFGVVYAAQHLVLKQRVAVKVLKPQGGTVAEQNALTDAFLREARVLFTLSHKAIVRFYEVGTVTVGLNSVPYVVLELLDGHTLEDEIVRRTKARGPHFTREEIGQIFLPVLEALALAHDAGVVHRDLKPANIMLVRGSTPGFAPKILDFGTARAGPLHASTTQVAFTPRYAAPEQWDATYGATGAWTDVFALGATLYEAMTLGVALPGDGIGQIMRSSLTFRERVDVARARPDLPAPFGPLLARSVAASPTERFASATVMRSALVDALHATAAPAAAPPPPPVYAPPPGTTGPRPPPPYTTQGAAAARVSLTGTGHHPAGRRRLLPDAWAPYTIGIATLLIGLFVAVSYQSCVGSCNGCIDGLSSVEPPTTPQHPNPVGSAAKVSATQVSNPALGARIKVDELKPCFAGKPATTVRVTLKRTDGDLSAECAPSGTMCSCAAQIAEQWAMPELKDGQTLSFSVVATP